MVRGLGVGMLASKSSVRSCVCMEPSVALQSKTSGKSSQPLTQAKSKRRFLPGWESIAIFLVILLVAGIRFRLLEMPLERDEGEYAYAGQLILQGIPPYELAYNMLNAIPVFLL